MGASKFPIPTGIPGVKITDENHSLFLRRMMANLCGQRTDRPRFPGSQPVSFSVRSLELLNRKDFWVCEKSDGVRVLVLIVINQDTHEQEVYLVDRKDDVYQVHNIRFPHQDGPAWNHGGTVLDGELVIDVIDGRNVLTLLLFDILACDSDNLMGRDLRGRYGKLQEWIIKPFEKLLAIDPELHDSIPFIIKVKRQELAYGIEAVFREHLPNLKHGNDGLIFTCVTTPYHPGTDPHILKWKAPEQNSIDFTLQLKFPPLPDDPNSPDFFAKPVFRLMMNCGEDGLRFFDTLDISDQEWEDIKASKVQYDDRVVEVVWDFKSQTWKMERFRDDKTEGNFKSVVLSVIESIKDGVSKETLIQSAGQIKHGYRSRQQAHSKPSLQNRVSSNSQQPPPSTQSRPPIQLKR